MDLLNTVQPSTGWFCVLGLKGEEQRQFLVETRGEVDEIARDLVEKNWNVFFAVAKFATGENRRKDNVQALKAFWVDIDCGENKAIVNETTGRPNGYLDQAVGRKALSDFCEDVGLPDPIVVNSGRGIHAYWPLTEEITRQEWEPVAKRLKDVCVTRNFYADSACTTDAARVLRIPGTFNFKDIPPKEVKVIREAEPVDFEQFKKILGVKTFDQVAPERELSELTKSLMANNAFSFHKIMIKGENGCQQLLSCFKERATLSEPRWFNALSIAKFCEDKDVAIHKLSKDHPDYDPATTEEKIEHIKGPHGCAEFEKHNSGGCQGCPHKGAIKSPILLGKEILRAETDEVTIESELEDEPAEVVKIPPYPSPYFRGKNGGVYREVVSDDGEILEPVLIYEHDLYVMKRMHDRELGDVVLMKVHLPRDGIREFVVPNTLVQDPEKLRPELSKYGILADTKKRFEPIGNYVLKSLKELQTKKKAEIMRSQFGWADHNSKFIIGDREISADGIYFSPPSKATKETAEYMQKHGTLEGWKEVFSTYGREGLEPHAFAALTAFGSPLLKFTGQNGAAINVIHPDSGTGKSTILYMINSVYGHPKELCGKWKDTGNSVFAKLGIWNCLPYTIDEITNMPAALFSDYIYGITQGKGKDRLTANSELRSNIARWATTGVFSSNSSATEKMQKVKNNPAGELARLIEYTVGYNKVVSLEEGKELFDRKLFDNWGHAGDIYMQYLVSNLEEVRGRLVGVQTKIDRELNLTPKERYWSAVVASNITGGMFAKRLGLIDWDLQRIYKWAADLIQDLKQNVKPPATSVTTILGDYMNRHIPNTLVINDGVDLRTNKPALPQHEPTRELYIRVEPDTKQIYLTAKHFKNDCVEGQIHYKEVMSELKKKGILVNSLNKRLSKGMKVNTFPVHTLQLNAAHPELEELIKHGDREGQLPN